MWLAYDLRGGATEFRVARRPVVAATTPCIIASSPSWSPHRRLQQADASANADSAAAMSTKHDLGGITIIGEHLLTTVHVAQVTPEGAIVVPPGTRRILFEIGCSDRDTMDEAELAKYNDSFLISFEPLLDKYARLLERGNIRYNRQQVDRATPLGHHHARGVVLPLAVSARAKPKLATFNVSRIAGCSSLLRFNEKTSWGRECFSYLRDEGARKAGASSMLEMRMVPTISMDQALSLAPAALPIELLKLDTQGMDLKLLRSASKANLARVAAIELEVVKSGCTTLYIGQETHLDVDAFLQEQGFKLQSWKWDLRCEGTGFFRRQDLI
ncbi:hypothetical protein Ctob_014516 [Chrysochromulina tobinii]|uniref:Methyltransferase FkbM domain-containing protein n=1 Tax=Chrysochromulina tobinii TaxID=1460289 RepID=A0A0M0K4J3_9EUKA|nr:hypothetical protein Ctob_014516 [Chrysochromulina tobinii]|eukprot:KOO33791.1 hypothetical protein Ctob_014516 [Chrysochromulina sp. CCMP291]